MTAQLIACGIQILTLALCNAYWSEKRHIWEPAPEPDPSCCYDDSWRRPNPSTHAPSAARPSRVHEEHSK